MLGSWKMGHSGLSIILTSNLWVRLEILPSYYSFLHRVCLLNKWKFCSFKLKFKNTLSVPILHFCTVATCMCFHIVFLLIRRAQMSPFVYLFFSDYQESPNFKLSLGIWHWSKSTPCLTYWLLCLLYSHFSVSEAIFVFDVGIDYLSVAAFDDLLPSHLVFLEGRVRISSLIILTVTWTHYNSACFTRIVAWSLYEWLLIAHLKVWNFEIAYWCWFRKPS